jgi:uncharacterized tellurite resistance protein B-like protein
MCAETSTPFIDYFSAIAPSIIALIAVIIASQQWFTNRNQLKNQLFDRRIEIYQSITRFISEMLVGDPAHEEEERTRFLRATKDAYFLFDEDIKTLVEEIRLKTNELRSYSRELQSSNITEEERKVNIQKQRELHDWLENTLKTIEPRFIKYLKLKH